MNNFLRGLPPLEEIRSKKNPVVLKKGGNIRRGWIYKALFAIKSEHTQTPKPSLYCCLGEARDITIYFFTCSTKSLRGAHKGAIIEI